jgi:multidrug efflux pump subunit AcrB
VGENVYARMEAGEGLLSAAVNGAREMAVPVTFSILTTVAAFSPLFFVPGVTGKIFGLIPMVVVTVLVLSLVEAFFILPAHLGHGGPRQKRGVALSVHRLQQRVSEALQGFSERVYRPVLEVALRNRYVTLCAAVALLLVTLGMVASGRVPFTFFPSLEGDVVKVTARLPFGVPVERTQVVRVALETSARAALAESGGERILRGMFTRLGENDSGEVGSHLVTVELNLVPGGEREVGAEALAASWSRLTPPLAGLESLIFTATMGPGAGRPVDVQLSHQDSEVLARASEQLTETLRGYPALRDVENAYAQGKPQLDFRLLPQARTLGLTAGDVGRQLRASFFGAEALREQRGRNEVRVMVRLPESQRRSEYDVEELLIRTPAGGRVPLSYVASFERGRSPTVIRREDGKRVVNVSAELAAGARSPREVLDSLQAEVLPRLQAEFPGLKAGLVGQQREQAEVFRSLGQNFLLALLAIYALLAVPFKSYIQPLIIMSAIPFGFVGAVGGHILMGYGMSVISMLGVVALSGVVVNDSLVLIDATNGYRARGQGAWESIVTGGTRRLRPILLTSLTTFMGLAPMILETSMQARFLIPMAISLGFGVLFATVIILLLVPSLYLIVEDVRGLLGLGGVEEPLPDSEQAPAEVAGAPAP